MLLITTNRDVISRVRQSQRRNRGDWPAVFSTNPKGEVWPWVTWGVTPEEGRENVRGNCNILDEVTMEYLAIRPEGGRFFIDDKGAYYTSADGWKKCFAWFFLDRSSQNVS